MAAGSSSSSSAAHPTTPLTTFSALHGHPDLGFLADNELVHGGYRWRPGWWAAFLSLGELHNETLNVATHLLALLVFAALLVGVVVGHPSTGLARMRDALAVDAAVAAAGLRHGVEAAAGRALGASLFDGPAPTWPLAVFLMGLVACLAASVTFHLFFTVSPAVFALLARWDYTGITALIFSSSVPCIAYTFGCRPVWLWIYLALAVASNATTAVLGTMQRFSTREWRSRRAAAFVVTGCMGVVPLLHGIASASAPDAPPGELAAMLRVFAGLLVMGGQYMAGALIYATRVPEVWAPGRFDTGFSSHAIFHCLVVSAAATHWFVVRDLWHWRGEHPGIGCVA